MTKTRHDASVSVDARAMLAAWNVERGQDFHTLSLGQVEQVIIDATLRRYQKPANANGSRARYFYALVQRRAGRA